jgi:protein-S-isoprenylcysteine O-methyltransferase Ste14
VVVAVAAVAVAEAVVADAAVAAAVVVVAGVVAAAGAEKATALAGKTRLEEKVLDGHFGQKYADYRRSAKALIALIW